jgi:hypothetical protein
MIDRSPGKGLRSLQLWRKLAEVRRALEHGPERNIDELLREAGIDESLFAVARAQLDPTTPRPVAPDAPEEPATKSCVVRSQGGRISLKVV